VASNGKCSPSSGSQTRLGLSYQLLTFHNFNSQLTQLELEFFLRLTVSRPVSLGIGPPFGTLDQILACSSSFVW
jgi:hypothetical protein